MTPWCCPEVSVDNKLIPYNRRLTLRQLLTSKALDQPLVWKHTSVALISHNEPSADCHLHYGSRNLCYIYEMITYGRKFIFFGSN